jgi:hypothetical protein
MKSVWNPSSQKNPICKEANPGEGGVSAAHYIFDRGQRARMEQWLWKQIQVGDSYGFWLLNRACSQRVYQFLQVLLLFTEVYGVVYAQEGK